MVREFLMTFGDKFALLWCGVLASGRRIRGSRRKKFQEVEAGEGK